MRCMLSLVSFCTCLQSLLPSSASGARTHNECGMDVVIVSKSTIAILQAAVEGLRNFLQPCPRSIYIITPRSKLSECQRVQTAICIDEKKILDIDRQEIKCSLASKGSKWAEELNDNRELWYYQQILKLFSAKVLSLSKYFYIWDADNILLRPYSATVGDRLRVLTSGLHVQQYVSTSSSLLGFVSTNLRIVTHHALVNKTAMLQIIHHLCPPGLALSLHACARHILSNVPHKQQSVNLAFSEYHLYLSWVLHHTPNNLHIDNSTRLCRKPVGSAFSINSIKSSAFRRCTFAVLEHVNQKFLKKKSGDSGLFRQRNVSEHCSNVHFFSSRSVSSSICLDGINPRGCVVYSFGINYQWDFDDFMHSYGCIVYSFDPGMSYRAVRSPGHFFFPIGLAAFDGISNTSTLYSKKTKYKVATLQTLMRTFNHTRLDVVRFDVAGAEWDVLHSNRNSLVGVNQLSMEIHMWARFGEFQFFRQLLCLLPLHQMQLIWVQQNRDKENRETMTEIRAGVTRVYETTFKKNDGLSQLSKH